MIVAVLEFGFHHLFSYTGQFLLGFGLARLLWRLRFFLPLGERICGLTVCAYSAAILTLVQAN